MLPCEQPAAAAAWPTAKLSGVAGKASAAIAMAAAESMQPPRAWAHLELGALSGEGGAESGIRALQLLCEGGSLGSQCGCIGLAGADIRASLQPGIWGRSAGRIGRGAFPLLQLPCRRLAAPCMLAGPAACAPAGKCRTAGDSRGKRGRGAGARQQLNQSRVHLHSKRVPPGVPCLDPRPSSRPSVPTLSSSAMLPQPLPCTPRKRAAHLKLECCIASRRPAECVGSIQ